jgi:hypothetical protein
MRGLLAAVVFAVGCSNQVTVIGPPPPECDLDHRAGDTCVGPNGPESPDEPWLDDVGCRSVFTAASDAELAAALQAAMPGDCIDLMPGGYSPFSVPGGVHVLGRGAPWTFAGSVQLQGSSTLRGLTVTGSSDIGIEVRAGSPLVDAVVVGATAGSAVTVDAGASLMLRASEIGTAGRYAIEAFGVGSLTVERTLVRSSGPLWVQCDGGCDCPSRPIVSMSDVVVRESTLVGVSLVGVAADLDGVYIERTTVGMNFEAGDGLSVSGCSTLDARGLHVVDNADFGVLLYQADGTLDDVEVRNNLRGLTVLEGGQVSATRIEARDNVGVGITLGGGASLVLREAMVADTKMISLPVLIGGVSAGAVDVGDGITWCEGAYGDLEHLTISNSARHSILIDGAVAPGSRIADVTLTGGDEQKGIVQQNLPPGGSSPSVYATAPFSVTPWESSPAACMFWGSLPI